LNRAIVIILSILPLLLPGSALAGSFKVVPVRLSFDARSKSAVVKITNEGEEKVTVQLDAKTWSQDDAGVDLFEETADILFFPRMATIEKGEERIIRVGYQGKPTTGEQTYRLFIHELPVVIPGEMAIKFALTMSIPIFISPHKEISDWRIEEVGLADESLKVKVRNSGNSHLVVSNIKASGLDDSGADAFSRTVSGWYSLPGSTRLYILPASKNHQGGSQCGAYQ
jgi:fimbrial chaperone protein